MNLNYKKYNCPPKRMSRMSDSESNAPNKCEELNEVVKIKIIKSRKPGADSGLVEKAIKMFKESKSEELKNRLIDLFWDLHKKKCLCERHSRDFPSHPLDVNALKICKKKHLAKN